MNVFLVQRMQNLTVTHTEVYSTQQKALDILNARRFTVAAHGEPGRKCEYQLAKPHPMLDGVSYWLEEVSVK